MTASCGRGLFFIGKVIVFVVGCSFSAIFAISEAELEKMAPQNPNYLQDVLLLPEAKSVLKEKSEKLTIVEEAKSIPIPEEKKPEITLKLPAWPQLLLVLGIISLFILYRYRQKKFNKFRN